MPCVVFAMLMPPPWIPVLLLLCCAFVLIFVAPKIRYRNFPGPPCISLITGHFMLFEARLGEAPQLLREMAKKYGRTFQTYWMHKRIVVCCDPDDIRYICVTENCPKSSAFYGGMRPFFGTGLLLANEKHHTKQKETIRKLFNSKFLVDFHCHMKEELQKASLKLDALCGSKTVFDLDEFLVGLLLDVISRATLSVSLSSQILHGQEIKKAIEDTLEELPKHVALYPLGAMYFSSYRRLKRSISIVHSFIRTVVKERATESPCDANARPMDLLDIFQMVPGSSEKYLVGEVSTFLTAGHDTTAHTLAFLLFEVAAHPNVERRILEELELIYGDSLKDEFAMPTKESLHELKYCNMVWNETLRLHPVSATGTLRTVQEHIKLPGTGFTLEKGTNVLMPWYVLHRDPEYWNNPDEFIPERFTEGPVRAGKNNSLCFIPFGLGSRNCIGQFVAKFEAMAIMAVFFSRYKFQLACEPEHVKEYSSVLLRPRTIMNNGKTFCGLPFTIDRRE